MQKNKFLLQEEINRLNELGGTNIVSGKHLVVIDVQPEYQEYFSHMTKEFMTFLNENFSEMGQLTFLFNGDNIGMISEANYKYWLYDNGLDEEIIESSNFYDKGYGFFRYCMDKSIDEDTMINLIRYMIEKDVFDTRELDEDFWNEYIERYGSENVRKLLEFADDSMAIPDLMDELKNYYNIMLCGGGIDECLKEVELALKVLDKPYTVLTEYTY